MINFKAHLIDSTQIKEKYNEKYINKKVNLIELNPQNKQDMFTLKEIGAEWNYGYSLAKEIHIDAENTIYYPEKIKTIPKFYALTKQNQEFKTPKINDILALAEIEEKSKNVIKIVFLQVNPEYNYYSYSPDFKYIGTGFLNVIKKIFKGKTLTLQAAFDAVKFYLKNGFNYIDKNSLTMYLENPIKDITKKL